MEDWAPTPREKTEIRIPIRIAYHVLEVFLREKFTGEEIKVEKDGKSTRYARILELSLRKSSKEDYDLVVDFTFQLLTTLFRNKKGKISLDASVLFNEREQQIGIDRFELEGKSTSWLMNTTLEALANRLIREKLKKNLKYDFRPHIAQFAETVNEKLMAQLEAYRGLFLTGELDEIKIKGLVPGREHLLVSLGVRGHILLDIKEINFQ